MLKSDKLEFQRGAAAKTENQDRYKGKKKRHHDMTVRSARHNHPSLSPIGILSKDTPTTCEGSGAYEKTAVSFAAMLFLVGAMIWLR
jgi:hypothetical protein